MATEPLTVLQVYRQKIDAELTDFFAAAPALLAVDLSTHSKHMLQSLSRYALRPGKRLRGSLAAAAYDDATQQQFSQVGIQLAVVLELIQDYLLIIDDVMDKSALRRGEPALQTVFAADAAAYGGAHEANMLAVNVGVLAQHLANLALARLPVPPAVLNQAVAALHANISATAFGQLDDLYQQVGRPVSQADILRKYQLKSSYYTFINPLQLGVILGGQATPKLLANCRDFGGAAGIAFQLHDDYLGIFGDSQLLGKSNLDDIQEGKYTLLVQYAVEHGAAADVQQLKKILGTAAATATDLRRVQAILERSGAKTYAQQQARSYAAAAKQSLAKQPIGSSAFQALLIGLLDYAIERQQ